MVQVQRSDWLSSLSCHHTFSIVHAHRAQHTSRLNFNCSLILYPILRGVLRFLNNYELSPTTGISTYVPIRKNISFHKAIAAVMWTAAIGHTIAHFCNYANTPQAVINTYVSRVLGRRRIIIHLIVTLLLSSTIKL